MASRVIIWVSDPLLCCYWRHSLPRESDSGGLIYKTTMNPVYR
nr:hypothetical protein [Tanacetum cinerariifolium]